MSAYDWSKFTLRITVDVSIETLYEAWLNQELMELWFLRLCEFRSPDGKEISRFEKATLGDSYKWLWHGHPDNVTEQGKILKANGTDIISFSFGKAGNCTVKIKEVLGENIVELTQEQIPTDDASRLKWHLGCKIGWTFYLSNLKSILEGGIDLRNKNDHLSGMINS